MKYQYRHPDVAQEEDRVPSRWFFAVFVGLVSIAVALIGWAVALVGSTEHALRPSGEFPERHMVPAGPLAARVYEGPAIGTIDADTKRRLLATYGWVDRDRRIVRIPVNDAIDALAEGSE